MEGSLGTWWGHAGQLGGTHEPAAVPSPPPCLGSLPGWGTGQRMLLLSEGSLPSGWLLVAAVKVPLGEKHQASGSGPA